MAIISNATTIADAGAFSVSLGSLVHIKSLTASSSSTLSFVHGSSNVVLDGTYPIYKFEFINMHPDSAYNDFMFNASADSGSNYNVSKTSSFFSVINPHGVEYGSALDVSNNTGFMNLTDNTGSGDTQGLSGYMLVFAPSNTTFSKHFICNFSSYENTTQISTYVAGFMNTTSAVNAFQFKFAGQNMGAGKIKLYGIKDS